MSEEKINVEETKDVNEMNNDEVKEAAKNIVSKVRTQALLLGSQAMCSTILQKIKEFDNKPGKRTLNDHRRLVADIRNFCEVGLSRKINLDGTTSPKEENESKEEVIIHA